MKEVKYTELKYKVQDFLTEKNNRKGRELHIKRYTSLILIKFKHLVKLNIRLLNNRRLV